MPPRCSSPRNPSLTSLPARPPIATLTLLALLFFSPLSHFPFLRTAASKQILIHLSLFSPNHRQGFFHPIPWRSRWLVFPAPPLFFSLRFRTFYWVFQSKDFRFRKHDNILAPSPPSLADTQNKVLARRTPHRKKVSFLFPFCFFLEIFFLDAAKVTSQLAPRFLPLFSASRSGRERAPLHSNFFFRIFFLSPPRCLAAPSIPSFLVTYGTVFSLLTERSIPFACRCICQFALRDLLPLPPTDFTFLVRIIDAIFLPFLLAIAFFKFSDD